MIYTSLENPKIKELKKLHTKKYRDKSGLFLVEGEHLVLEAYKTGYLQTLILEEGTTFPIEGNSIFVSHSVLSYLSQLETPKKVMGVCKKIEKKSLDGNVLILDDIQDPGNLGTMIRSAVAFHFNTILLSKGTVDPYNGKVVRASQGLLFHINIDIVDLNECLSELKKKGYYIIGTKVTHGTSIKNIEKNSLFAIIMGNEGNGMNRSFEGYCNDFVYIDMDKRCESLNVGVAASILMYELDK